MLHPSAAALRPNLDIIFGKIKAAKMQNEVEIRLSEITQRLQKQNWVLLELAKRQYQTTALNQNPYSQFIKAVQEITETAAQTLAVDRVSVWLYQNDRFHLHCINLYQQSSNSHSAGIELAAANYPHYFQALETERTIAAHEADVDPRTKEFAQGYLTDFQISSMLDSPIRLGGKMVGVVCHEQVGLSRHWTVEEENFAGSIADLVSLAIEARDRAMVEAALRLSEEKFAKAFRASPNAITISTLTDGCYLEVNDSFLRILQYTRPEVIGYNAIELNIWVNKEERIEMIQMLREVKQVNNLEFKFRKKSGEIIVGLLSAEIINLDGEECILALIHDITERVQAEKRDRLLGEVALRIRRSLELNEILNNTVSEVRQLLQADRVLVSYLDQDQRGKVLAESVDDNFSSCLGLSIMDDNYLQELRNFFANSHIQAIEDTSLIKTSEIRNEYWRIFQVKAVLAVPILWKENIFGILLAHQCTAPRQWQYFEMDLLSKLANQVAIAIHQGQLYQQLTNLNANLERQVEERTAQLQQKMQELQELNRLKDVFLHAVSHDLRTPVMGTLMVLNNLLKNQSESLITVPRQVLERMIQSSDRQLTLINSLLEVHGNEVQGIILHYQPMQITTLIDEILAEMEPLLVKNRAAIVTEIEPNLPIIDADATALWRVFENLITNALKHNPPGITLTIRVTINNQMIDCSLTDNGIGMNQEQCDRLFDLYYRGTNTRHLNGIGLGLYVCRQIITAHGGKIGVISHPGHGAKFWFTLPINR